MKSREEVLGFINDIIVDNQGEISSEDTVVRESGIDSFGFAVLFLELDDEYDCFDNKYTSSLSSEFTESMTIGFLIDRVEECS